MNPIVLGLLAFLLFGGVGVTVAVSNSIPTTYDSLFQKAGAKYAVPWLMLKRICMIESSIGRAASVKRGLENPYDVEGSKSFDGKSWGIMQVTLTTAKDLDPSASVERLNNPAYSVDLAAKYLAWLMTRFPRTDSRFEEWVVKSYNQGPGNTAKERAGSGTDYAGQYWAKYKKFSQQIV